MQQVFLIKTFEDLVKAFKGNRDADDPVPKMEIRAQLKINLHTDTIKLVRSDTFRLDEALKGRASEFVTWCINQQISSGYTDLNLN